MGLLGKSADPYGGMSSLLGIDQNAMRRQALFNGLAAAGFTLMGDKNLGNAGGAFLQGTNQARDDYMKSAFDAYRLKQAEEERAYGRERDTKADERWQEQFDYNRTRQNRADAWDNTQREQQMNEWQRQEDMRAGQQNAVEGFTQNFQSQGGDLFSPEMQMGLRQQGIAGVDPADTQKYNRMQPYMGAQDYGGAFQQMTAESAVPDAPNVQTVYGPDGREMKVEWRNGQWVPLGGAKAPSNGITIGPDGTVQIGGGKPLTEGQSKDTVFATRAEGALPYVDNGSDALTSMSEVGRDAIPLVGNYLTSKEYQVASSAGKEFLQALLRKDTGATIQPFEIQEYGSVYLPQPGDTKERLAYKKEARHRALAAMKAGMPPQAIVAMEKALAVPGASGGATPQDGSNPEIENLLQMYGGGGQ